MAFTAPRRVQSAGFDLQPLESRVFLSGSTPTALDVPSPAGSASLAVEKLAPADLLTKAVRQSLLNHWSGENKASLQAKLNANQLGAFDAALLEYMRERPGQTFVFKQSDVDDIVDFINDNLSTDFLIGHADDLVAHRFPEQGNSDFYEIQLPAGDINWSRQPASTTNPEFLQGLNRQEFWPELAQAYRFTRNVKYINELIAQLSSWSQQNPGVANPAAHSPDSKQWNLLDTSVRAHTWVWVHQTVLNASAWTAAANTLMLAKLWEHGDYLRRVRTYPLNSNRTLIHASALLHISQLMHEFNESPGWETYGRNLLFGAMDAQFHPDGGHIEQSPNYAVNGINDLLEAYWLDRNKGDAPKWPAERVRRLTNAMETHVQLLSPNGALAALSDTYRSTSAQMLTKARTILGTDRWPAALPRLRDVWLFGVDAMEPLIDLDVSPSLGDRGDTFGMPDSGYYVMRSGTGSNSRQLTFDAGPTGGVHGHFDLLNFELFGYGKPLIADPGVYKYDGSPERQYVVSTPAHNTLNVDGISQAAVEGIDNPNIVVDQWTTAADHAQVAAHHFAYGHVAGSPVVGRNIWYDYGDVALIVDWAEATTSHAYTVSFNLPGDADDVSGVLADGSINTKYASGNVRVAPLLRAGQTAARGPQRFISNQPPPDESDPAYRYTVAAGGTFQVFATLVTTYSGRTPPTNVTAEWVTTNPQPGQPVVLRLTKDGVSQDITFAAPTQHPSQFLGSRSGGPNDLAFDSSGRLHLAYFDRVTRNLKYTVRDTRGVWSTVQTIDPTTDAGEYVSLALDSNGVPGVAYFDGNNGDLKYARFVQNNVWDVRWVDWTGQVGLYPSLTFTRTNDPIMSYYHRTNGDLRLAVASGDGWSRQTVDSSGDVGRFSSIQLDPNYPNSSDIVVAYEHTSAGAFKYAAQFRGGWKTLTIDAGTTDGGGYTSLAFSPVRDGSGAFQPTVSYYDANETSLKFATYDGAAWHPQTLVSEGNVGLYTAHVYDAANRATVLYYNKSVNKAYRATLTGGGWVHTVLGAGGREISAARHHRGALAYSTLDERGPLLEVNVLAS